MKDLHDRIATATGWPIADCLSMSLGSLRELVRPIDAQLANDITNELRGGSYIVGRPSGIYAAPDAPKELKAQ